MFNAFGVEHKMTPAASKVATRLAVTQGSFREAKDTLALLGCGDISVSKLRKETLRAGEACLAELRKPEKDVLQYSDAKLRTPDGARRVPRTLVIMADGTNPPCTKADTADVKGKSSAQAKSRQLRVTCACEYVNVTDKGVPIPIKGSFSYGVTDLGIGELTSLIHEQTVPPRESSSQEDASRRGCSGATTTRRASAPSSHSSGARREAASQRRREAAGMRE